MSSGRRFAVWSFITIGLWWLAAALLALTITIHLTGLLHSGNEIAAWSGAIATQGDKAAWQVKLWNVTYAADLFALWLDLWAGAALIGLAWFGRDPAGWARFAPFTCVVFGVFAVIGRPVMGLLSSLAASATPPADDATLWAVTVAQYILAPALMPFLGFFALGLVLAGFMLAGLAIMAAIGFMPAIIIDMLRQREITGYIKQQEQDEAELYVGRMARWLRGEPMGALPDDGKGSRFAYPIEIEAAEEAGGIAFGHINDRPIRLNTDKHIFVQASTRSGKGVAIIIPHLLRYRGSAFVLDPKGENARATGRRRALLNDAVHVLDPFGISGMPRSRFNPLSRFTPANMEAASKSLAAAFFSGERDHWSAAGQQLLALLILFVYASDDILPESKDLGCVRLLLLGRTTDTLRDMTQGQNALLLDGMLASVAQSFLNTPERELGSIISTAQRETEILDNPFIVACLAATGDAPEVDFSAWRRGTMSVFLCLSAPKFPVFARWLRLVLTSALDEMTDVLDPPPVPVSFVLDELASLGTMHNVADAISLAAGYGVQLMTIFQDIAQMRELYKARWPSFIGNAGIRVVFNLDDYESADYWTRFIGTDSAAGQTHNVFGMPVQRASGEPLLSPDEMMRLFAANKMLVLKQGMRPFVTDRVPYFVDAELGGLWDDPRGPARALPEVRSEPEPPAPAAAALPAAPVEPSPVAAGEEPAPEAAPLAQDTATGTAAQPEPEPATKVPGLHVSETGVVVIEGNPSPAELLKLLSLHSKAPRRKRSERVQPPRLAAPTPKADEPPPETD